MTFPVVFHIFGLSLPSHQVMELLGYTAGFQTFIYLHRKQTPSPGTPGEGRGEGGISDNSRRALSSKTTLAVSHSRQQPVSPEHLAWLIVAAVCGAALGSKILAVIESFPSYYAARSDPKVWLEGKTIVGGLLGGWLAVELAKKMLALRGSSSDAYAPALCVGIAIGRIGCFLTGLPDHTYGIASSLPWAVDFGDGIPRHPTQLYESLFAILMFIILIQWHRHSGIWWDRHSCLSRTMYSSSDSARGIPLADTDKNVCATNQASSGQPWRLFILMYFTFRFLIEFIKPVYHPYAGLSAIQLASLTGATIAAWQLRRVGTAHRSPNVIGHAHCTGGFK